MLVETDNLVSAEEFRKDLDRYVAATRQGSGPIAVTQHSQVVGFFIGVEEYEAMFGTAVKKLLAARASGPTVSHEEARKRVREVAQRRPPKS
jgi:prevent-host-death family protein